MNHQKLNKWGNGQGFRVDKKTIRELNLEVSDKVEYHIKDEKLVIVLVRKKKSLPKTI